MDKVVHEDSTILINLLTLLTMEENFLALYANRRLARNTLQLCILRSGTKRGVSFVCKKSVGIMSTISASNPNFVLAITRSLLWSIVQTLI